MYISNILLLSMIILLSCSPMIAQGELPSLQILDLSPRSVQISDIFHTIREAVSYSEWMILSTRHLRIVSDLWFQKGTCTDYASSRRPELFVHRGHRLITGNARDRLSNAKTLWILTHRSPKVWSIAVFLPEDGGASTYGHVAYVESVQPDGVIVISDMNYSGKYIVTTRTVSIDAVSGYID
jgi:hypothetical protein